VNKWRKRRWSGFECQDDEGATNIFFTTVLTSYGWGLHTLKLHLFESCNQGKGLGCNERERKQLFWAANSQIKKVWLEKFRRRREILLRRKEVGGRVILELRRGLRPHSATQPIPLFPLLLASLLFEGS
jgi:hypothetical protein